MSYSSTIGRFLEMDPAGYVDGPNRYQAEMGNPVNHIDPLGLWTDQQLFHNWHDLLKSNGLEGEFAGLWGALVDGQIDVRLNYANENFKGSGGSSILYVESTIIDKYIVVPDLYKSKDDGVCLDLPGPLIRQIAPLADISHELWHAFFSQVIQDKPTLKAWFVAQASGYGAGVKNDGKTLSAADQLIVLDEAIASTITNWVNNRLTAEMVRQRGGQPPADLSPCAKGYLSGKGLSDEQKQDTVRLSKNVWTVAQYLLAHGAQNDFDPNDILNGKLK